MLLSAFAHGMGLGVTHPLTGVRIEAVNLFSSSGLHRILTSTVTNFTQFAPVGTVLVAVLGMGVAEHSGLLSTLLRATIQRAPAALLTFSIVLCGVLSSLAADTGYVILIPLAALMFHAAGRHPVIGIAAAFAGVSGGYSANLLITPLDAILAGIATEAAQLAAPGYQVSAAGNYYFMVASSLLIAFIGTWVTDRLVAPRFPTYEPSETESGADHLSISSRDKRGLLGAALFTLVAAALVLAGLLPEDGILRDPKTGAILQSP